MSRVRGWCPSAHRPMLSGDGWLVRVQPALGYVSGDQMRALCDLAERFGSGLIDLTSRGNLQVRGVSLDGHVPLLDRLVALGLAAADPLGERPLTVTPLRAAGGLSERVARAVQNGLAQLPQMPAKVGIVVDAEATRALADVSGDFRFEQSGQGLILRADGAARGRVIDEAQAFDALSEMVDWFLTTGGAEAGRLRHHVRMQPLPEGWQTAAPVSFAPAVVPDLKQGRIGIAFGRTRASVLRHIIELSRGDGAYVTPWRMLILDGADAGATDLTTLADLEDVIGGATDPRTAMDVCPGAPDCAASHMDTRAMARELAGRVPGHLHISGCAKGCARARVSDIVLVGTETGIDLVQDGRAGDEPALRGLASDAVVGTLGQTLGKAMVK